MIMAKQYTNALLLFIVNTLLFFSCAQNDDIENGQDEHLKTEQLRKDIIGKWKFDSNDLRVTGDDSYIQFTADGIYIVNNGEKNLATDKFLVTGPDKVSLNNFGSVQNIKISDGAATFELLHNGKNLSISAKREIVLPESERTEMLSRKWKMLNIENGVDTLALVDSSFVTFIKSGTYLTEAFVGPKNNGPLVTTLNWRWHSTLSDRIVYWRAGTEIDEDKNYIIIRELSDDTLKITESNFWGLSRYTFKSAGR